MAEEYEADPRGAAIEFRKHLGWYVKGVPGSGELRRKLHAVVSLSEVEDVFAAYLSSPHHEDHGAIVAVIADEEGEPDRAPAAA
jgi:hypothetical protein